MISPFKFFLSLTLMNKREDSLKDVAHCYTFMDSEKQTVLHSVSRIVSPNYLQLKNSLNS